MIKNTLIRWYPTYAPEFQMLFALPRKRLGSLENKKRKNNSYFANIYNILTLLERAYLEPNGLSQIDKNRLYTFVDENFESSQGGEGIYAHTYDYNAILILDLLYEKKSSIKELVNF